MSDISLPRVMTLRDVVLFNITAIVGLRWLTTASAFGPWVPALIFVLLAAWSLARFGSATSFAPGALMPKNFDYSLVSFFATMTFAFAGLELAPTLGGEIHDPAATLRRGILVSGIAIVAMYIFGTAALLVALPVETVSITNGIPQAAAAIAARLDAPQVGPVAALLT